MMTHCHYMPLEITTVLIDPCERAERLRSLRAILLHGAIRLAQQDREKDGADDE
jgi:hypothetical protein